ncbi:MAG: hypothetical protein GXX96_31290 [Planctomycetaceae bacterium]|nr:hypothetical protein [Planctomycetaceae bacterium]
MTTGERAAQIWSILALASWNRQVLTYNLVAKLTGVARVGLGHCLEPIQSYCLLKELHPLTILVVSEKSGMPGVGFIAAQDIPRTQQQVFSFDWVAHGCPPPEVFERAVRERPSNGVIQVPEE